MHADHRIVSEHLVDQQYWDTSYAHMAPAMAADDDPVRRWIEAHVPPARRDQHVLEIGCFPGRYLAAIARLGYAAHGIDLTPGVIGMGTAFKGMGLPTGTFTRADFLTHRPDRLFDVVCSFGFIEHFTNWEEVLLKHAALVAPNGLIVLETPNFKGPVQGIFHRWLDAENLARHNQDAMDPPRWAELLRMEGFEILEVGWFGRFTFWSDSKPGGTSQRIGRILLRWLTPLFERMGQRSRTFSPYCGLVARKR